MDRYVVFKQTGTHADVLAAIGAADVLRHLEPRIVEFEDRFEIQLPRRLHPSDLGAVEPGFSYLLRAKKAIPSLPPERIVQTQAAAGLDGANASVSTAESRMYSILGLMKAYGGPNQVVSCFAKMKREKWEAKVWECLRGQTDFVFSSPLVQLFNPHAGKGYALLKPRGTNRNDKTKDRWAEPFVEWLRFRGYFEGSAGWFASGDLRLFCPIPADVPYSQFVTAAAAFRDLRLGGTGVKMDCRAVLGLTRRLIEGSEIYRPPRQWVRGVSVTQYKDMGQAHTVMAMEQLAVPDWFDLRTAQQAQSWLRTLEEHDVVLRRLTDSHSDEFALLKQYRRTLQASRRESIAEFVEFLMGYGILLFKRRAQGHWLLPQFSISGVTPILRRDPGLRMIVRNPGFLAVVAAVRSSTVGAQAARRNGKFEHREVHYGLLCEIRRAGLLGRRELLAAISAFVTSFNRETGRRHAMGLRAARIQDGEMDAFAGLLERLPSSAAAGSLVCGLASCVRGEIAASEVEPELAQAISA
jgi:hypothetical protein